MSKSVLLGIAAFGGLLLVGFSLIDKDEPTAEAPQEEATASINGEFLAFPTYPGSVAASVRPSEGDSSRDLAVSLNAQATIAEVNEWYREALSSNGWQIKSDKNVGGYQIIQGERDNLYTSLQAANGDNEGTVRISQQMKVRKE